MEGISLKCLPHQWASVAFFSTPHKQENKTLPKVSLCADPKDPEIILKIIRIENSQPALQYVIYCLWNWWWLVYALPHSQKRLSAVLGH